MKTGVKSTSAAGVSPSGTGKCSVLSVKKAARNLRRRRSRSRPCSKHRLAGPEDEPTTFSFSISSSSSPPAPSSGDSSDTDAAPGRWRRPGGESGDRGSHGAVSAMGRTRVMEDAVSVEPMFISGYDFFGVYDGHGGSRVSQACRVGLHRMLAEEIRGGGGEGVDWGKAMAACFRKMDDEVCGGGGAQKGPAAETVKTVGSTAVVAVVGEEVVVVANCGDSRAVLCRRGVAVPLSNDHKPGRVDELRRIEAAGGKVINWNGDRVLGVLATSRSIGDQYLKPFVTSEPEVTVTERDDGDEFLVLASDGLWDVVSNEVACKVVRRSLYGSTRRTTQLGFLSGNGIETQNDGTASEAAAVLSALAIARGSKDNISVIVIELRKPRWSGLASMRS